MKKVFDAPEAHAKDGLNGRWTRDAAPMRLTLVNGTHLRAGAFHRRLTRRDAEPGFSLSASGRLAKQLNA